MPTQADIPVVSVVMPVYNGARWLQVAVNSVLAQTLTNLEVLIVDDASVDETARIAEQFASRDGRVQLLRQSRNQGQAAARNLALKRARGAWIAPVDADDEIRPDRLRLLVEAGERESADLIADGIVFRGARPPGAPAELMTWSASGPGLEQLTAEALIKSGMAGGRRSLGYLKPLLRRGFLEKFHLRYAEDLRFAEDFNLYVRALFCGARFLLFPESHYVYRQTPASASRTEVTRIARDALANSRRLRAAVPQSDSAELTAALEEYEERWLLMSWVEHVKRDLEERNWRRVFRHLFKPPASPVRIFRFARGRAAVKRQS